jgi:uncharacterized protein (TIGR03118 family)
MNAWIRWWRNVRTAPASGRGRLSRPLLEALEDRCLPSTGFSLTPLASDIPGLAPLTDPYLKNPWGVSFNPTGYFWLSEEGSGVSDLLDAGGNLQQLVVGIPSAGWKAGQATGTVFYGGDGFTISENGVTGASRFLFAGLDGTISGWNSRVDDTHALVVVNNSSRGAAYTGLALLSGSDSPGESYLVAANFRAGTLDVFDDDFHPVTSSTGFRDPNLPAGFYPFNVQNIGGLLYVTYARHPTHRSGSTAGSTAAGSAASPPGRYSADSGTGGGFVDVFSPGGVLLRRFASGGPLNSPWGLALAPAGFGSFSGALLVGNNGDGRINAFDPASGAFLGALTDSQGQPLVIDGLWGLSFGNGHLAGPWNTLYFSAGIDHLKHGLFGAIRDPAAPAALAADPRYVVDPNDDEYPLPPDQGPSLPPIQQTPFEPSTVFLAIENSSLVLAPTLSPLPERAGQVSPETSPTATPSLAASVISTSGVGGHGVLAAVNPNLAFSAVESPVGSGPGTRLVGLNALLNLDIGRSDIGPSAPERAPERPATSASPLTTRALAAPDAPGRPAQEAMALLSGERKERAPAAEPSQPDLPPELLPILAAGSAEPAAEEETESDQPSTFWIVPGLYRAGQVLSLAAFSVACYYLLGTPRPLRRERLGTTRDPNATVRT